MSITQGDGVSGRRCPHSEHSDDAVCVVPMLPRGAIAVRCPCCGLSGWMTADDTWPPMVCPECLVDAELAS